MTGIQMELACQKEQQIYSYDLFEIINFQEMLKQHTRCELVETHVLLTWSTVVLRCS